MEDFVENYFSFFMHQAYVQHVNSFKIFKTNLEKSLSNILLDFKMEIFQEKIIDKHIAKIQSIKKDIENQLTENNIQLDHIHKYTQQMLSYQSGSQIQKQQFMKLLFNCYIMEYLYQFSKLYAIKHMIKRQDFAEAFSMIRIENFNTLNKIIKSLKQRNLEPALEWIYTKKPKYKKIYNELLFKLLLRKLIQKIQQKEDQLILLEFLQEKIVVTTTDTKQIFLCVSLILGKTDSNSLSLQFDWDNIIQIFYDSFFELEGYDKRFFFETIILVGIKTLKTKLCKQNKHNNSFCPVCNKWIYFIGEEIEPSHRHSSILFCSGSNEKITEKNPAVTCPDNKIYGMNYVKKIMNKHGGQFLTKQDEIYQQNDILKLYFS